MNEQEIDNLVGRELDIAVEKYIFGREQPQDASYEQLDDGTWRANIPDTYVDENGYEYYARSWSVVEWPPYYHKSDCLVWQVVDTVQDETTCFELMQFTLKDETKWYEADFFRQRDGVTVGSNKAQSRTIAICRAALKVVCSEKERGNKMSMDFCAGTQSQAQLKRDLLIVNSDFGNFMCIAPRELFVDDYQDVPEHLIQHIGDKGLGCDGGGVLGIWCHKCHFFEFVDNYS